MLLWNRVKRNGPLVVGVLFVLVCVVTVFVVKVSGSESSIFVEGCTPYNIDIKRGDEENTVNISWKSKSKCSGYIVYGTEMKDLRMVGIDLENGIESKNHTVVLKSLLSSKIYYFSVVSDGISYGKSGLPISFSIDSL